MHYRNQFLNHCKKRIGILILFFLCCIPSVGFASNFYISTAGNDTTGTGSSSSPWRTFSHGLSSMSSGDTLYAYGGTYDERVIVQPALNGTAENPTIITSVPGQTAIIRYDTFINQAMLIYADYLHLNNIEINGNPSEITDDTHCLLIVPKYNDPSNLIGVEIDNVTVHNCTGHGIAIAGNDDTGTYYSASGTVQNSSIYDSALSNTNGAKGSSGWSSGLKVGRKGVNILFQNNEVYDNWGEGIAVTMGENVEILNNTVYNNFGVNIYIDNSLYLDVEKNYTYCLDFSDPNIILRDGNKAAGFSVAEEYYGDLPLWGNQLTNLRLENNIVYNCSSGFNTYGADSGTGGLRNSLIAHNTFYLTDTTEAVVFVQQSPDDSYEFKNNIIVTNADHAWSEGSGGIADYDYNYWVDGPSYEGIVIGTHDINDTEANLDFLTTPGFDATSFKIGASSLARDAGISFFPPNTITTDFAEQGRVDTPDMGAYEFQSTSTTTTTNTPTNIHTPSELKKLVILPILKLLFPEYD